MGKKLNTRITGNIWEQTEVKSERKIITVFIRLTALGAY